MAIALKHSEKQAADMPPGKCKANPLSQHGIKFICLYLRFLTSRMRRQKSWKAAVTMFFLTWVGFER